jgi:putative DNA primase/helicase
MFIAQKSVAVANQSPSLNLVSTRGDSKQEKSKSDPRSVELRFADEYAANLHNSQAGRVIYFWNGLFHEIVPREEMQCRAFSWLARKAPEVASAAKADALVDAALLALRVLPKRDDSRVIVPVQNGYLEAHADGKLEWLDADPALGMCYALNVHLPRCGPFYQPRDVPDDSLLALYFATSIRDEGARAFLQEMSGDTLMPNIRFQRAAVLKGEGQNGKSIFTRLMAAIHYRVAFMRLDELSGFKLMNLVGASLAIADEVPRTGLDEQSFKTIVSGETVGVDIKYEKPISVQMTAKWLICTNNDQRMADNTFGFWRRLVIIPFDDTVADDKVIAELDKKIIADELDHFLDWCLLGLQRLLVRGALPKLPPKLDAAKRQAVAASDPVAAWIEERFVSLTGLPRHSKDELYGKFSDWAYHQGYSRPPSAPLFWKALKARFGNDLTEAQPRVNGARVRMVNLTFE